jgi:type I restriction enzyme, S subunit
VIVRLREDHYPRYFHYLMRTPMFAKEAERWSYGITSDQWSLRPEHFKMIYCSLPARDEQDTIVRFLDHTDRRIQRFIRAKKKLIALLNEQKQAIIHRAVTRGLDPNAGLKFSGSKWFPEIPQHWDVLPMRRVIRSAVDGPHHSPSYVDDGIPFLSARNIKADRWSLGDAKFISEQDYREFCERVTPQYGDVLYTKGGTTGVARAVDLDFPFQVWVHVAVLKVNKSRVTAPFLAAALNTPRCYEQAQLLTRGATNQDLGLGRMKDIVLPIPPQIEQEAIIKHVDVESTSLIHSQFAAQREIELLREYRTRLIADVVTGKLDVRQAAANLPGDDLAAEPFDDLDSLEESDEEAEEVDLEAEVLPA